MARPLRIEFPGAIYHVTSRMVGDRYVAAEHGVAGWPPERCLFRDDADRMRFLDRLAERIEQYNIRLYLFVCMANHFHLVFETPQANCSAFMQSLLTAYTVYYNLRHGRHGHLLDGRYKAKPVEGDAYLLALSRYVHLNPAQVGALKRRPLAERIKALRAYRWSSYPSYAGRRKALDFVDYGPLLAQMHGRRVEWPKRYCKFVESGLAQSDDEFKAMLKQSPRSIGGETFRAWIDELYRKSLQTRTRPEDVSFRHITEALSPEFVLEILGEVFGVATSEFKRRRHGSPLRAVASRLLIRYAGESQRNVADLLGLGTGSAVSKQLTALPGKLDGDRSLRRLLREAENRLEAARASQGTG